MPGIAQNQASRSTSTRCWVSRRYTLTAERNTARAEANTVMAARAGIRSQMTLQSGRCQKATMKASRTTDWNRKNMKADPTDDSARISRGKATFLTMAALDTTELVPVSTAVWKRFHTNKAENM